MLTRFHPGTRPSLAWAESALSTGGHSCDLESPGRGVSLAPQWGWPASGKGQGQPRRAGPGQPCPHGPGPGPCPGPLTPSEPRADPVLPPPCTPPARGAASHAPHPCTNPALRGISPKTGRHPLHNSTVSRCQGRPRAKLWARGNPRRWRQTDSRGGTLQRLGGRRVGAGSGQAFQRGRPQPGPWRPPRLLSPGLLWGPGAQARPGLGGASERPAVNERVTWSDPEVSEGERASGKDLGWYCKSPRMLGDRTVDSPPWLPGVVA